MLRSSEVRDSVERGTEGGMARENMELQKLVMILVLYGAMVLKSMSNCSGTETILSYVKTNLQVHSRDCPILMRYKNLLILILSLLGDYPSG